jgi:hypothetical protein
MFRKMLIGAFALIVLVAAPAAAEYNITVTPGTVVAGGEFTVGGEGCRPGEEVTITVVQVESAKAVGDVVLTTTVVADANGEFTVKLTMPAGTEPGVYEVRSDCANVKSARINVVAAGGGGQQGGPPIVRTGSDLDKLGLVGAALLTFGGLVLIVTKTRRHSAKA